MARQQLHGHLVRKSTSCCAASVCSAALLLPRSEVAVTMLRLSVLPADKIESSSEDDGLLCSIIRVGVEASAAALAVSGMERCCHSFVDIDQCCVAPAAVGVSLPIDADAPPAGAFNLCGQREKTVQDWLPHRTRRSI